MSEKKVGKRLLTWVLVLVMTLSLLPLNVLAANGGSPHDAVVNGYYDDNGTWKQGTSSAQPDVVPGIVSVSKTAARAANTNPEDNTYEVTLRVETEGIKDTNKAATVLVIDTSASMNECMKEEHTHNKDCYTFTGPECTPDSNPDHWWIDIFDKSHHKEFVDCNYDSKTDKHYMTDEKVRICDKEEHSHRDGNCYTRLDAAKKAAIDFLDSYRNGAQSDSGRYVALVAFNVDASNSTMWKDVSSSTDYTAAKDWINGLSANEGTNLDAGLSAAGTRFSEAPVSSIAAENRNIIVLTDGGPTYCLDSDGDVYGLGSTSLPTIFKNTNATAKDIRDNVCPIHTICFAADNETIFDHNTLRFISLSEYLRTYIASDRKAYNASSYDELTDAFSAISDIITSHLTEAVVYDSLPTGVTETGSNLFNSNGEVAWNLFEDFEKEETAGDTTVYTKTYTVTIDPETAGKADGEYCPLNGQTTLTVKSQSTPNGATLPFPIPAGLVTVQNTPEPEPTEPSKEEVKKLLGDNAVQIICTNGESNHGDKAFGLIDDTFTVRYDGQYTCEVKIDSFNKYVEEFNTELGVVQGTHISDTSKASEEQSIVNLKWEDGAWTAVNAPAKHYVLCVTPKYTVTYTDGVDTEEVFADQVYGNLLSGTTTPAFNGSLTRTDYVFVSWNPAVSDTVTESVTYVAQWKDDKNNNGTPDDEEEKYTVTYTDGVDTEEVFADQVYGNLLSGTTTPAFNGTPTRKNYTFAGWDSAVPETMPANDLTFTAKWEKNPVSDGTFDFNDVVYGDGKVTPAITKTVKGNVGRNFKETFKVTVEPKSDNAKNNTMTPDYYTGKAEVIASKSLKDVPFLFKPEAMANAVVPYGKLRFTEAGTYTYTVREVPGGTSRMSYDTTEYTLTIRVALDKEANTYQVESWQFAGNREYPANTPLNIVNTYRTYHPSTPSKPTVEIPDDDALGLNTTDHFAYIVGYGNGEVRPQNNITRAEVATIFFRLLTDDVRDENLTKTNRYSDLAATSWYNTAVSTLSSMGIITGYPDGTFRPNAAITRAEFAAIAARFDSNGDKTTAKFSDIATHWAKDEISIAYNNGWINGYPNGTFGPQRDITRAETMTLVNRVLNRQPETEDDLLPNMTVWTDNANPKAWYYLAVQEATNSHYYEFKTNSQYEKWTELRETRDWTQLEK